MKIGYIFPGQGTQAVGMGKDIYEKYEEARNVYKLIDNALNENIEKLTYEKSQDELNKTENTQISIYAMSMAILKILESKGIKPVAAAGLSLGEYSALTAAGVISLEDGAKIVRTRGKLMQNLAPEGNWAMAAIIGLEDNQVEEACSKVTDGFVKAVNYNCPGQVVVSGEKDAVVKAMENAKELGAKRVIELKTSGPFHTEKLQAASAELKKELEKVNFQSFEIPVIKNYNGEKYTAEDNMVEILANHVVNPVKFGKSIETMLEMGVDTFIEIGPGKTLSGFVKKVCKKLEKEVNVFNIENVETLESTLETIEK
jgi:[acyl-carrier-protein] S-malonyltransferase